MTTILVTGGSGQVGAEIARLDWGESVRLLTPPRLQFDLTSADSIRSYLATHSVDAIINSAAYTAVDAAEADAGTAFSVNALGPALLADASRAANIPLIQLSTDYVFSGDKLTPYCEADPVGPIGIYGASKLAGEMGVRLGNPRSVVLRTAWLLSAHGSNFLKTMRRLAATRPVISVVADQIGCPTSAADIAKVIRTITVALLAQHDAPAGIYHFVNAGEASWYELAKAIFAVDGSDVIVRPIATTEYPTPARRPANSRLATTKIVSDFNVHPRPWQEALEDIIADLKETDSDKGLMA